MSGAANHRGTSKQNYATPPEFIAAVVARFGPIAFDLAADADNAKALDWFDEQADSLSRHWGPYSLGIDPRAIAWLNPPFANIAPWAAKCMTESARWGTRIAFLVPASVGSNWYRDHIHGRAAVYFLNGRICFDGVNGFPKDCMLAVFGDAPCCEVWSWKKPIAQLAMPAVA